jgi:hypothetical protein
MITGGDVKAPVTAAQGGGTGPEVAQVALDALVIQPREAAQVGLGTEQRLDAMAADEQFADEIRPDEPRCAGNKAIHARKGLNKLSRGEETRN